VPAESPSLPSLSGTLRHRPALDRRLILVADGDARLVHASAAMLTILGLDLAGLKACRVEDIVAEGPTWTEREWQRYLAERTWEGPVALRNRSGAVMPANARAEIINSPTSTWHISSIQVGPLIVVTSGAPRALWDNGPRVIRSQ
jgi:hypothetical protein